LYSLQCTQMFIIYLTFQCAAARREDADGERRSADKVELPAPGRGPRLKRTTAPLKAVRKHCGRLVWTYV